VIEFPPEPSTSNLPEPRPLEYDGSKWPPSKPLVIDVGSHSTRAGWAGEKDPCVVLRSLVGKAKDGKGDLVTLAGDQLLCRDISKTMVRSPFEKDVVQHFESMETILDYTLYRMGIHTEKLYHPVLVTEALCNPNYCRSRFSEILFECYGAPKVAYGVDALFAYDSMLNSPASYTPQETWGGKASHGLIIRVGHSSSNVIPIYDGAVGFKSSYRMALGGFSCSNTLQQLLLLRHPQHKPAITAHRVQLIKEKFCFVAQEDYMEKLREYESLESLQKKIVRFQLPYTEKEVPVQTEEEIQRRKRQREEQAKRLREMASQKRQEKLRVLAQNIKALLDLQNQMKGLKGKELAAVGEKIAAFGISEPTKPASVSKFLGNLSRQLNDIRAKHKAKGFDVPADDPVVEEFLKAEPEEDKEESFPLLNVPDDKLSAEDREKKRKQKMMAGLQQARLAEKKRKTEQAEEKQRKRQEEEEERKLDPQKWLTGAKQRHANLFQKYQQRQKKKAMVNDRRSEASNERMKAIISTLAGSEDAKKKNADGCADDGSDFGDDDDDWNVYRQISREAVSDSSEEEVDATLAELDAQILELDPLHIPVSQFHQENEPSTNVYIPTARDFQLALSTELIQVPEILFQPSIIGLEHCGMAELINNVLNRYNMDQRMRMAENVYICGGGSLFPGFKERIEYEIRCLLPAGANLNVVVAHDPILETWRGASKFAAHEKFESVCLTKQEWEEKGPGYLIEHRCSNKFFPSIASTM